MAYAAAALGKLIPETWRREGIVFVPVPPSKMKTDPEYDPRLLNVLRLVWPRLPEVRELVVLTGEGFDSKQKGLRPAERAQYYSIAEGLAQPEPEVIILFDDILTTGCHFKAMEIVLRARFPLANILGLFLARTVRPTDDNNDLLAFVT